VKDTLMLGPTLSLSGDTMWLSAMYMMGTLKSQDSDMGVDMDIADSEAVLGFSLDILDIGVGARYSTWTDKSGDELKILGPMAYVGLGNTFGESALGWYVGASYMFMDLGDAKDLQDEIDAAGINADVTFEHFNVEAGLSFSQERLQATLGYRMKYYLNWNEASDYTADIGHSGVAASASFVF
jgi:hypothetical protein